MADLAAFSCGNFDTTTWINDSFRERPDEEALESYLASLAMKLHIISQDYTDQLETGMVEAMTTMPRVLSDVARIEEVLKNIEGEMQSLAAQLRSFDLRNVAGVEDLSRLDNLKNNMEQCKATLEEHARWSQVVREAKNFLESGGRLSDSADRIETMYRSLEILQNLPGHDERKETCEALSSALLAALRPRVRRDIVNLDLSPLFEYLYVYDKLGRKSELEEEYVRARPERLKGLWDQLAALPASRFNSWLPLFLSNVTQLLGEEAVHAGSLFGSDRAPFVLCSLLQHTLVPLATPMAERLLLLCKSSPLPAAEIYGMTDDFARTVGCYLDGCSSQAILAALSALYAGFSKYSESYGAGEGAYLQAQLLDALKSVTFEAQLTPFGLGGDDDGFDGSGGVAFSDPVEAYDAFGERLVAAADAVFEPTQAAVQRSLTLQGGLRVKPVCRALVLSLCTYTKQLAFKVDELRIACGFSSDLNGETAKAKSAVDKEGGEEDREALHLAAASAECWAGRLEGQDVRGRVLVPSALRALQAAGRLSRKLCELEGITAEQLSDLSLSLFRDVSLDKVLGAIVALPIEPSSASSPVPFSSVGAAYVCVVLQNDPSASSELRSFFASSASHHVSQTVFAAVSGPLSRLKAAAGALLFDLCTAAPEKMVCELRADDAWGQGALEYRESRDSNKAGDSLLTHQSDSLLPLPAFTQVGEHLLSLVQELEAFASSDALPDLWRLSSEPQTLALLSALSARGWKHLRGVLELKEEEGAERLCSRASCATAVVAAERAMFGAQLSRLAEEPVTAADGAGDQAGDLLKEDEDAAALSFVNEWLGAIADSAVGLLVTQLVQITALSPQGRAQLLVDIEYVSNVVQAMGLRHHPLLSHMRQIILKDPLVLLSAIDLMPARSPVAVALQRVDARLAKALCVGHGLVPAERSTRPPNPLNP